MIYAEERYNKIMELLSKQGSIYVTELMTALNISRETVRRDLNKLAQDGLLLKTHGGAVLPNASQSGFDYPFATRQQANRAEKAQLCAYAAQSIQEADTLFLDNSSTVAHMIKFIPKQYHLNIIVNSVPLLLELAHTRNPNWNIFSLGGSLVYNTVSTGRHLAVKAFENFRPSKAFLSCHSVDNRYLATDSYLDDIELKRCALELSDETFLLADYSKFGHPGSMKIVEVSHFSHIITNEKADPVFIQHLRSQDCDVHIVVPNAVK